MMTHLVMRKDLFVKYANVYKFKKNLSKEIFGYLDNFCKKIIFCFVVFEKFAICQYKMKKIIIIAYLQLLYFYQFLHLCTIIYFYKKAFFFH